MTPENNTSSNGKKQAIIFASILGGLLLVGGMTAFFVLSILPPKLQGTITVDGSPFTTKTCRSGSSFGFSGVQLADSADRRIRVITDPGTGATKVAFFNSVQTAGEDLGQCATLEASPQNSTVNGTKNQQGAITFSCAAGPHTISGALQFKNCH